MDQTQELQNQINALRAELEELRQGYYRNNFSQQQIFNKYSDFTDRIKMPVVSALSSTCEQGEVCVVSSTGKIYVASAANTWTIAGTQS